MGSGGSDAAAGTSYALRWLTIAKALGAAGIASGDTLYITPGKYRETVTVAMTSAVAETLIIGDVDGSHTSGLPGVVEWTAYTTNDTTAPAASPCLNLAARDFLTFRNIFFVGGSAAEGCVNGETTSATNITFTDCTFLAGVGAQQAVVRMQAGAGVSAHWLFDRCTFTSPSRNVNAGLLLTIMNRHTSDYDCDVVARNCIFVGGGSSAIRVTSAGAGVGFGGGVIANACTFFATTGIITADANIATSIPCQCNNSLLYCGTGLNATTSGQITETYNSFTCNTPRTNVTAGTGSQTAYAPLFHVGQELKTAISLLRPFGTPIAGSPLLGFGAGTSPPSVDFTNRLRPSGGASLSIAAGALERHDFGTKETGTVDTGTLAVKLTGPGDHQFLLPVTNAVSRTVTLKVNYDATHATTNPPQAQLVANNAIGYAGEIVTAAASTGSFLTLAFAAFTPTANGYVILRLISRSAAGNGVAIFDTVTVT